MIKKKPPTTTFNNHYSFQDTQQTNNHMTSKRLSEKAKRARELRLRTQASLINKQIILATVKLDAHFLTAPLEHQEKPMFMTISLRVPQEITLDPNSIKDIKGDTAAGYNAFFKVRVARFKFELIREAIPVEGFFNHKLKLCRLPDKKDYERQRIKVPRQKRKALTPRTAEKRLREMQRKS